MPARLPPFANLPLKGLRPSRRMGQNFLILPDVADRMVERAGLSKRDHVLEVGPGFGVLTERLSGKAGRVYAVEKDGRLATVLKEKNLDNVTVIMGDALRIKLPEFNKVVSNLPYSISSPITFRLLRCGFERAVLMYQLEFGERMIAKPGSPSYSRLSLMVQAVSRVEIAERVGRGAFWPRPKVDSVIVVIEPKPEREKVELDEDIVRMLFQHKRRKAHKAIINSRHILGLDKERAVELTRDMPHREEKVYTLGPAEVKEIQDHIRSTLREWNDG